MPHAKNGSNGLLQAVKPEQLKTTPDLKTLQPRSGYCASLTDMLRDVYIKNAKALGYDPYLRGFPFQLYNDRPALSECLFWCACDACCFILVC